MNIKSITLLFENGEDMRFSIEQVESCRMKDIQDGARVVADGQMIQEKVMYGLDLVLKASANEIAWEGDEAPFARIQRLADLRHLSFEFEGMRGKTYRVAWHDLNASSNAYQQTTLDETGELHILVQVP